MQAVKKMLKVFDRRRLRFWEGLNAIEGIEWTRSQGAFYLFPKSPISDDVKFVQMLKEELILAIPGIGFGAPGYFRLSYAVPDSTIENSFAGFKRAFEKA